MTYNPSDLGMLQTLTSNDPVYRIFFEENPCPMGLLDPDSLTFLDINTAGTLYYGYTKDDIKGVSLADIRAADDNLFVFNNIKTSNNETFRDMGISSHRKKNGEVVYVHIYTRHIIIDEKRARLIMMIDENKKVLAEKKNKELYEIVNVQKKRLDYVLSNIDDIVWGIWADTYELIFTNKACEKVYGYTEEEMMANKELFFNSIHVDDRAGFYESSNRLITTGKAEFEFRVIHKNGNVKYLRGIGTVMKGENGSPDICCGLNIDITREKEMQAAIENNKRNLRALIDNTNDFIWSVDTDCNLVIFNKAFKDFLTEVSGKTPVTGDTILMEAFGEKIVTNWKAYYKKALQGERFTIVECNTLPNGNVKNIEVVFNPIFNSRNQVSGVSCMSRNITDSIDYLLKLNMGNKS